MRARRGANCVNLKCCTPASCRMSATTEPSAFASEQGRGANARGGQALARCAEAVAAGKGSFAVEVQSRQCSQAAQLAAKPPAWRPLCWQSLDTQLLDLQAMIQHWHRLARPSSNVIGALRTHRQLGSRKCRCGAPGPLPGCSGGMRMLESMQASRMQCQRCHRLPPLRARPCRRPAPQSLCPLQCSTEATPQA